jgi:hypothetical protein
MVGYSETDARLTSRLLQCGPRAIGRGLYECLVPRLPVPPYSAMTAPAPP